MIAIDKVTAGLALAVCLALLVRLSLGSRLRQRVDRAVVRGTFALRLWLRRMLRWRASRTEAARAAEEVIERARRGSWDGNVYSPKSFRKPRKPH